jgi:hypothetical protein
MDETKPNQNPETPTPPDGTTPRTGQPHPAHEAHGGSMAPGLVDDTGRQIAEPPPAGPED